jgi:hypothetical protein
MSRKLFAFLDSLFGDMSGVPESGPHAWLRWFANYGLSLSAADYVLNGEPDGVPAKSHAA